MEEEESGTLGEKRSVIKRVDDGAIENAERVRYKRRGFIGKAIAAVGSTLATTVGISTTTRAEIPPHAEKAKAAAREYASESTVRREVEAHAADLIEALSREGYIEDDTPSVFSLGPIHKTIQSYVDSDHGVLVSAQAPNGKPAVKIQIKRQLSNGKELIVVVNPRREKSRAVIRELESEDQTTVLTTTRNSDGQVITEDCTYCDSRIECSRSCGPYSCGCEKIEARICRDDSSCDGCYTVDYSCCGDYNCDL